jgi:hypothetical protein
VPEEEEARWDDHYYYLGKRKRNKTKQSKEWSVPPSVWDYCVL